MPHIRIDLDRGDGWSLRGEGDSDDPDGIQGALRAYAIQYPHRALIDRKHLVVCPAGGKLTAKQLAECRAYASDHGTTIEFLP